MAGFTTDARKLVRELKASGFEVELTGSGHYRVTKDGDHVVGFAATPTDWRWERNTRAAIRRYLRGWRPPPRGVRPS